MRTLKIISLFGWLMMGVFAVNTGWAAPTLSLGSASGLPGQTVNIPVNFTNDGSVVSLQFDVQYNAVKLSVGTPTGVAGLASSDVFLARRIVIKPSATNAALSSATIATIPFTLQASASGSLALTLANVVMTNAAAVAVSPVNLTNGAITAGNSAPTANAGGPYAGVPGTAINFNGSASSDPENNPLTYAWNFGDGGTGTGVNPSHSYATAGNYTVSLTVNDGQLSSAAVTAAVTVGQLPDLIMTAVSTTTTTIVPNGSISLTNTVKNQGGLSASSFTIAFHLSANATYGDADDIVLTATRTVTSLTIGGISAASTTLTIPATTPVGSYFVCGMVDNGNVINEGSYENNNVLCATASIVVAKPDLILTAVGSSASSVNAGSLFSVTNTVKNQGTIRAGGSTIAPHLSLNTIYGDVDDVVFTLSRSITALDPGVSKSGSTSLTMPANIPANSYYICAMADSADTVIETNEVNNTLCSVTPILVPKPDLLISSISTSATSAIRGSTITVSNTAKNQGGSLAGSLNVAFHLSSNTIYGDADDIVSPSTRVVSSLGVNAINTVSTAMTITTTAPIGIYYICAKADDTNNTAESDEGNNAKCTTGRVSVQ